MAKRNKFLPLPRLPFQPEEFCCVASGPFFLLVFFLRTGASLKGRMEGGKGETHIFHDSLFSFLRPSSASGHSPSLLLLLVYVGLSLGSSDPAGASSSGEEGGGGGGRKDEKDEGLEKGSPSKTEWRREERGLEKRRPTFLSFFLIRRLKSWNGILGKFTHFSSLQILSEDKLRSCP